MTTEANNVALVRPTSTLEKIIRTIFPVFERVAPSAAQSFAVTLFIRPFRFPYKKEEEEFMESCERFKFDVEGVEHHGFKLGSGPEVVCAHGWSGRSTQFRYIAPRLVEAGYTFVAYDALAHGRTEGRRATMFDFAKALGEVIKLFPNTKAVIGHSLGAASVSFAIADGVQVPAFVILGAPVKSESILDEYVNRINGSQAVKDEIRRRSEAEFNADFDQVVMESTFKKVTCPVLGIHGKLDVDAPVEGLDVLKSIRPDMETLILPNMGHRRILKEEPSLSTIINWIKALE